MKAEKSVISEFIKQTKSKDALTLEDSEVFVKHIDTGVYVLNGILGGDFFKGMELGRTTEICGESASGKSAIAIYLMVKFFEAYPENSVCFLYETEGRISESLIEQVPTKYRSRVIVTPTITVDELNKELLGNLRNKLEEFREAGKDIRAMVVLDSLGNLGTAKEHEDSAEGKNSTTDMKRAQQIKKLYRTISIPLLYKYQVPFVTINHVYAVIGAYVPTKKASGGSGAEYLSNSIIEVRSFKDEESKANKKHSIFKMKLLKSMTLAPKTEIQLHFINGKFNKYSHVLTLAIEYKVVTARNAGKKGKVYIFDGKEYTKKDLKDNEKVMEEIVRLTNDAWKKDNSYLIDTKVDDDIEDDDKDLAETTEEALTDEE